MSEMPVALEEIKKRRAKVPDGWVEETKHSWIMRSYTMVADDGRTYGMSEDLSRFYAHAPDDIDYLISRVGELQAEAERLRMRVEHLEVFGRAARDGCSSLARELDRRGG